jgi:hypothetical protein
MKSSAAPVLAGVVLFLTFPGASARAGFIPWNYSWTRSPIIIPADNHGTGGIAFTLQPTRHLTATSTDVVASSLIVFSSAPASRQDHITKKPYQLTLVLQDETSHAKGVLNFTGMLSGNFWAGGASIHNTFTGPLVEKSHLGHYWYTVTMGTFIAPTATQVGFIEAHVSVEHNPEPSSLVLAGLGLALVGLVYWRRLWARRAAAA